MSRIFWVSTLAAAFALSANAGERKRVVLDVPGMNCSLCPISVKMALEKVPGVLAAKADLATKSAEATYEPDRVSPDALARAATSAGFPATIKRP